MHAPFPSLTLTPTTFNHEIIITPCRYINWLQEACPSDGAEATLLLERCARRFQDDSRYKQDPRYLKARVHNIHTLISHCLLAR